MGQTQTVTVTATSRSIYLGSTSNSKVTSDTFDLVFVDPCPLKDYVTITNSKTDSDDSDVNVNYDNVAVVF